MSTTAATPAITDTHGMDYLVSVPRRLAVKSSASSPVIHITGQVDAAYLDQDVGFLHGAKDQLGMLDRVSKAAFRASSTDEIPDVMRMAIQLAVSGRPGTGC